MTERSESAPRTYWGYSHPWLAGLLWSVLFWPPFALFFLVTRGAKLTLLVVPPLFVAGSILFSVLYKRRVRQTLSARNQT